MSDQYTFHHFSRYQAALIQNHIMFYDDDDVDDIPHGPFKSLKIEMKTFIKGCYKKLRKQA